MKGSSRLGWPGAILEATRCTPGGYMTDMRMLFSLDPGARALHGLGLALALVALLATPAAAQVSPRPRPEGVTDSTIAWGRQTLPRLGQLRGVSRRRSPRHRRGPPALGCPLAARPRHVRVAHRADQAGHFRASDLDGQADADARLVQHAGRGCAGGGRLRVVDHPPATADAVEAAAELTAAAFHCREEPTMKHT